MTLGSAGETISPDMTINEIVQRHPRMLGPLERLGIDTCCGGHLPLEEVARRHGFELEAVLADLRAAADGKG